MSRIVLTSPTTLVAKELANQLAAAPDLKIHQIDLLSSDEQEVGVLADIGSSAAMVGRLDPEQPLTADLIFCCGDRFEDSAPYLKARTADTNVVLFAVDTPLDHAHPFVPWVGYPREPLGATLLAPHPGVVIAASLLHCLEGLDLQRASATVLEPASMKGDAGMDEVLGQTRAMLAFEGTPEPEVFPTQQAFNLNASDAHGEVLSQQIRHALPGSPPVGFQVLRGGTFHSVGLSLEIQFAKDPGPHAIRDALESTPRHEFPEGVLGTMDAAAQEQILIGDISSNPTSGSTWIWAAADNLTVGTALNGVEVARALLTSTAPN